MKALSGGRSYDHLRGGPVRTSMLLQLVWVLTWLAVPGTHAAAAAVQVPLSVTENAGLDRPNGHVTSGVPLPMGAAASNTVFCLFDEQEQEIPVQSRGTATWRDGSVKWVLLDFQLPLRAAQVRQLVLRCRSDSSRNLRGARLAPRTGAAAPLNSKVEANGDLSLDTGALQLLFSRAAPGFLKSVRITHENLATAVLHDALAPRLQLAPEQGLDFTSVLAPEELALEENGPLRAVVRCSGWITSEETNRLLKYVTRVTAFAGSSEIWVQHTITQLSERKMLLVSEHALELPLAAPADRCQLGGNRTVHARQIESGHPVRLAQLAETGYKVASGVEPVETGLKAPGWIRLGGSNATVLVGVKHFAQQFPKALEASPDLLRVGLYPAAAAKPFDMDQGLAKTHELLLRFEAGDPGADLSGRQIAAFERPLFAIAPAAWYCDSKAFGDLLPFDFDRFPDYETLTEASADQFSKRMATGTRHWGDVYYGGEYKGTNSYTNLEYDMHHNFFLQFARTGLRKYLDTGLTMARHQADIDTNHKTGWQWKHSPRHTEIQAEFGHTFTRGLLEAYFLTGNRSCFEAAVTLGNFFAKEIQNPRALGNERQIGWALISLLPVYEATWDRKYFLPASNTVERLMAGLDADGKFTIRWDNRIAFFNGIAATGFLYYYRATGDERVADAAYRVIRRARGFYPEYAGRTLEAIAWACERTTEPEWFDFLARTWETTMARQISWNVMELGAPTIFTAHALPFMVRTGLLPEPDSPLALTPAQFDTGESLHAHHLPAGDAELYLRPPTGESVDVVLIRKGAWKSPGKVTLWDHSSASLVEIDFPKQNTIWQRKSAKLPPSHASEANRYFRLTFRSPSAGNVRGGSYVTWDVVTSKPCGAVFCTPEFRGLQFVTPALYGRPVGGASAIELELAAEGEGFKRAAIYDSAGDLAGAANGFIDLGDQGRYRYRIRAELPADQKDRVWSISLQDVTLEILTGLAPYFSTSRRSFFSPGKSDLKPGLPYEGRNSAKSGPGS